MSRDPFAEFKDWLIDGPAGQWSEPSRNRKTSESQNKIITANAQLLIDSCAWHNKVESFEVSLSTIESEESRSDKRAEYAIRFDGFGFNNGDKDFANYRFPCSTSFANTRFGMGAVSFFGAQFTEGDVSFNGTQFGEGDVWFNQAHFESGNVSFSGAHFGEGSVWFEMTQFGAGHLSFHDAHFADGVVSFMGAQFGEGDVSFHGTQFGEGRVWFDGAQSGEGRIWFDRTKLQKGEMRFNGARFSSAYLLNMDLADTQVSANDLVIAKNLHVNATFRSSAAFRRLNVEGTTDFSGSNFGEVPDFRDARFARPPEVAAMVVPPPKLVRHRRSFFEIATDKDDVTKYRKLKAMALAANDHEKDGEFFAYEMLAKRGVETTGFIGLLFNTLYHQLSNFGQSYVRPMVWMGVNYLAFLAIYSWIVAPAGVNRANLWFVGEYSLRNTIPLFGSLFRFAPTPKDHQTGFDLTFKAVEQAGVNTDALIYLGIIQSFIGLVLLFLLLLALRNKFRLK